MQQRSMSIVLLLQKERFNLMPDIRIPSPITLRNSYNMSTANYTELYELQNGLCAICQRHYDKLLCVDHDHDTDDIRGLLCYACNNGLGMFQDNVALLAKAIIYLSGKPIEFQTNAGKLSRILGYTYHPKSRVRERLLEIPTEVWITTTEVLSAFETKPSNEQLRKMLLQLADEQLIERDPPITIESKGRTVHWRVMSDYAF